MGFARFHHFSSDSLESCVVGLGPCQGNLTTICGNCVWRAIDDTDRLLDLYSSIPVEKLDAVFGQLDALHMRSEYSHGASALLLFKEGSLIRKVWSNVGTYSIHPCTRPIVNPRSGR